MSNSNGKITAPVSIKDVQEVLGETSNDLKTLVLSDKVNKWSRYKPIDRVGVAPLQDAEFKNNAYGLDYDNYADITECANSYNNNGNNSATYNKPTSHYRLSDFKDYNHSATFEITGITCSKLEFPEGSTLEVMLETNKQDDTANSNCVKLVDLLGLNFHDQKYFGIALYEVVDSNGNWSFPLPDTPSYIVSATKGVDEDNIEENCWINIQPIIHGRFLVVPFMSTAQYSGAGTDFKSGGYWAIPGLSYKSFPIVNIKENVEIIAKITSAKTVGSLSNGKITVRIEIENLKGSTQRIHIFWLSYYKDPESAGQDYEQIDVYENLTAQGLIRDMEVPFGEEFSYIEVQLVNTQGMVYNTVVVSDTQAS